MNELGLGIGLNVTPKDYTGMLSQAYVQQGAQQSRQQQNQEELAQYYMKNVDIDKSKFHRLVLPEVSSATDEYISKLIEAKTQGTTGFQSRAAKLLGEYKTKLGELSTVSNQYMTFEKVYADPTKKVYKSDNVEKAWMAMQKAQSYKDVPKVLQEQGVANDYDFAYDPNGNIFYTPQAQIDFKKGVDAFTKQSYAELIGNTKTSGLVTTYLKDKRSFTDQADKESFLNSPDARKIGLTAQDLSGVATLRDVFNGLMLDEPSTRQLVSEYNRVSTQKIDAENLTRTDENALFDFYNRKYNTYGGNIKSGINIGRQPSSSSSPNTSATEFNITDINGYNGVQLKQSGIEWASFPPYMLGEDFTPINKADEMFTRNDSGKIPGQVSAVIVKDNTKYVQVILPNKLGAATYAYVPLDKIPEGTLKSAAGGSEKNLAALKAVINSLGGRAPSTTPSNSGTQIKPQSAGGRLR